MRVDKADFTTVQKKVHTKDVKNVLPPPQTRVHGRELEPTLFTPVRKKK